MSMFEFDDKTRLALLMAGLMGGSTLAGCRPRNTNVMDQVPPDASGDARLDGRVDGYRDLLVQDDAPNPDHGMADAPVVVDPLPPDASPDGPMVSDPLPPDASPDGPMVSDMVPPDASPDGPMIADPLPPDASAAMRPGKRGQRFAPESRTLPLRRDFRAHIHARRTGEAFELKAATQGARTRSVSHRWICSGGVLESAGGAEALWIPPAEPGRHMVQVTVRNGRGAIAVDVFIHDVIGR